MRAATAVALFGALSFLVPLAMGQEDRAQITPGERKAPRKKDAGPRALGLVQLGTNGKASLIPIAILIDGKFWDASAYKADPIPMALDSGTVYEGERSGNSLGLFTVGSALHSNNANAAMPWLGSGVWRPNGTESPTVAKKAESAPAGISADEGPPRLSRDATATKPATTPSNSPASSSAPPASTSKPSGDEPPRLSKPSSSTPPADSGSTSQAPGTAPPATDSKPKDSKSSATKTDGQKDSHNVPASDSGAGETNRPRLRRGKPAESFADEDIPGYSLPGARPAKQDAVGKVTEIAAAASKDVQLIPAISDASGPQPKSFGFEWIPGEEGDRRKQMVDLAKDQVRAYVAARSKNNIAAAPARSTGTKRVLTPKLPDPVLENMQMVAYDLWNSNQPILILSAQAHMPAAGNSAQGAADLEYSVVVVGYPDIYHNLKKIFVAITDKFHLDMTPKLELIDAVDADGDGRGELLFRETSDQGAGWVVYRATADKLWKMFDSLNPL